MKIVEIIRDAHPEAHVVINSILPRGNELRDENPHYQALHDINEQLACYVHSTNARTEPDSSNPQLAFFNVSKVPGFTF